VLVYNPRKQIGKFAKWQVCQSGQVTVQHKLNDTNYVLHKGKGKAVVVHVDRMRKLPSSSDVELSDSHTSTKHNEPIIPPYKWHKTTHATDEVPSIHPTESLSHGHTADRLLPLDKATDSNSDSQSINVCVPNDLDTRFLREQASQSTDAAFGPAVVIARQPDKPHPYSTGCLSRSHRKPIRLLDNIRASMSLIGRVRSCLSIVSHVSCRLGRACTAVVHEQGWFLLKSCCESLCCSIDMLCRGRSDRRGVFGL